MKIMAKIYITLCLIKNDLGVFSKFCMILNVLFSLKLLLVKSIEILFKFSKLFKLLVIIFV